MRWFLWLFGWRYYYAFVSDNASIWDGYRGVYQTCWQRMPFKKLDRYEYQDAMSCTPVRVTRQQFREINTVGFTREYDGHFEWLWSDDNGAITRNHAVTS